MHAISRRLVMPVALALLSARGAIAQDVQRDAFWTEAELARIDEGLAVVNASRADLGFDKAPIADAFRLNVVSNALADPLSVGREAEAWDAAARAGDAATALTRRAAGLVGSAEEWEAGMDTEAESQLAEGLRRLEFLGAEVRASLQTTTWMAICASGSTEFPRHREARDAFVAAALLSQVASPARRPETAPQADAGFREELAKRGRIPAAHFADELAAEVAQLAARLRSVPADVAASITAPVRATWPLGEVAVYGSGDDVHAADENALLVIDLGGNDTYLRGASANLLEDRPVQVVLDLSGDDRYVGGSDFSFGGALGGVAVNWDCAGNDVYLAGHCSLGAGILGVGVLVDEGGDDVFRAKDFCQGAGAYGIGVFLKKGGNDLYHADRYGQGYASTWGCGVLADTGGNDTYDAGGAHLHAPLYRDRYQSLSQGFAIGNRPDASGGVGVLVDVAGNDRYVADIYAQGASYWYSLGLLIDDDGHDTYVAGQYSQGAGIHLSAGMLLDRAGNDSYHCANGVGVGGAHDFAVGLLVDRGGDDHYSGSGASQGCGHTNSVGILLDAAGDDGYCAVRGLTQGDASTVRNTGGIGLLLDGAGADVYTESTRNDGVRVRGVVGAMLDEPSPSVATGEPQAAAITREAAEAKVAEAGADLEKLWALASEWEVNDNRVIVPIARERLWALGDAALDRAFERLGSGSTGSGLEFRAVESTMAHFAKARRDDVVRRLLEATRDGDVAVRKGAVSVLAALQATEAADRLVEMLGGDAAARRSVLAALAVMKRAPPAVAALLRDGTELEGVNAAVCLGAAGDDAAVAALVGALGPETRFLVRTAATEQLAALSGKSVPALSKLARDEGASATARRNALRALGMSKHPAAVDPIVNGFHSQDRWVRLSAMTACRALMQTANSTDRTELQGALDAARALEDDPLVRRLLP